MLGMDTGHPPGEEIKPLFRLDIYYPGGPINSIISTRRTVNFAVSLAVLLLLVSSSIILFRLYRNTTRLRATEQDFVTSMSHELRTPIAVLQSTTENLKSGVVTDPQRVSQYSEIIYRETRRLAGMVENILLYSGLEKRTPGSNAAVPVDVGKLVDEVLTSLREPAREAHCKIDLTARNTPVSIRSDPAALRLILENLLLNAIRHGLPADRKGARAEIRLIVEQKVYQHGLVITVEDDGVGIPPREGRRIFEPFVRGEASVRAQRPGSGLGLHLVRRVVRILGGSITLQSPYENTIGQMNRGCRFTVDLPGTPEG
jgi:signal transduction histidine kinase